MVVLAVMNVHCVAESLLAGENQSACCHHGGQDEDGQDSDECGVCKVIVGPGGVVFNKSPSAILEPLPPITVIIDSVHHLEKAAPRVRGAPPGEGPPLMALFLSATAHPVRGPSFV